MYLFNELSGATFSPCKKYRYHLWRLWDKSKPFVLFTMLNPSTADETSDDPTVARCGKRAASLGFGGVHVCNAFALRSTDPAALYAAHDPVGPENDGAIVDAAKKAGLVICAWGKHGSYLGRGDRVLELLADNGIAPYCLRKNEDGTPAHPLYLPLSLQPIPY